MSDDQELSSVSVLPAVASEHTIVFAVFALMANASLTAEVTGVDATGRASAARRWLAAESDVEAVDETVDVVPAGEDEEGWANVSVFSISFCSCVQTVSGLTRGAAVCSSTPHPNDRALRCKSHVSLVYRLYQITFDP